MCIGCDPTASSLCVSWSSKSSFFLRYSMSVETTDWISISSYIVKTVRWVKEFLGIEGCAKFLHLTEKRRKGLKDVSWKRVQIDVLSRDDSRSITAWSQHLKDFKNFLPLIGLNDPISFGIGLMNLPSSLSLPHKFLPFQLLLPILKSLVLVIQVITNWNRGSILRCSSLDIPGTSTDLGMKEWFSSRHINISRFHCGLWNQTSCERVRNMKIFLVIRIIMA